MFQVGISVDGKKFTRQELAKMSIAQLMVIVNYLHDKIESFNEELMKLLIERDTLNVKQNSLHVRIEKLLK